MAQITVIFKDFEEMKLFAKEILKTTVQPATAQQPAPLVPAPVVQSAPVQQVPSPAAQSAPVQQTPAPAAQSAPVQQIIPTTMQSYTLDDLARAAMTLMDVGRQGDLMALLGQFGVETMPQLPKEQYGAFATALRGMGAKI